MADLDSVLSRVREHYEPDPDAKRRLKHALAVSLAGASLTATTEVSMAKAAAGAAQTTNAVQGAGSALGAGTGVGAGKTAAVVGSGVAAKGASAALLVKVTAGLGLAAALTIGGLQLQSDADGAPVDALQSQGEETRAADLVAATSPAQAVPAVEGSAAAQVDVVAAEAPVDEEAAVETVAADVDGARRGGADDKRSQRRVHTVATPPVDAPSTMLEELRLIREASRALRSGQTSDANRLLDEHQRRFPGSVLSSERRGLRLLASCSGSVSASTRAAAQRYVTAAPSSPLAEPVRKKCLK